MSTEAGSSLDKFEQAAVDAREWPFTTMTWPQWFCWLGSLLRPKTWRESRPAVLVPQPEDAPK